MPIEIEITETFYEYCVRAEKLSISLGRNVYIHKSSISSNYYLSLYQIRALSELLAVCVPYTKVEFTKSGLECYEEDTD